MPLELDPKSVEVLVRGRRDRDERVSIFVVAIAIFIGNFIANALWYLSNFDQATNSIYTAAVLGTLILTEVLVILYRWMELEAFRTPVLLIGDYVYDFIQVFVALLIGSVINQRWEYGSSDNILVNGLCGVVVGICWMVYKRHKNNNIRLETAITYQLQNSQLTLDEALLAVDQWINHDRKVKGELSIASFLNIRITTPSEDRESFNNHKLLPQPHTTYVSGRIKKKKKNKHILI